MPRPLVITALQIEHKALARVCRDRALPLRCIGPGPGCVDRLAFEDDPPSAVLLAGVAGGLVETPPVRLARVIDAGSGDLFTPTIGHDPSGGVLVSVRAPINTPEDKRALARAQGAHLVDCEAAFVARACEQHSIPWGVVRVVSDEHDEALPAQSSGWIDARGHTRVGRVLVDTLRRPSLVADLRRLASRTNTALRTLVPLVESTLDDLA